MTLFYSDISPFGWLQSIAGPLKRLLCRLMAMSGERMAEGITREEQFKMILKDYASVISGVCFSYASNPDDLKDLRQDIMINIWKGLKSYRGDSALSTWIYRVALNTCVSTVRKRSHRLSTIPLEFSPDTPDEVEGEASERIELLHTMISMLSPIDKAVLTMWLNECKYEDIAEVVGISRSNVAVRINRIKQKLSDKIKNNNSGASL